jgi:hypothetical protein
VKAQVSALAAVGSRIPRASAELSAAQTAAAARSVAEQRAGLLPLAPTLCVLRPPLPPWAARSFSVVAVQKLAVLGADELLVAATILAAAFLGSRLADVGNARQMRR